MRARTSIDAQLRLGFLDEALRTLTLARQRKRFGPTRELEADLCQWVRVNGENLL